MGKTKASPRGRPPNNEAVLKHADLMGGLHYLAANYSRQEFPRHVHQEYLIGVIESGVHDVWCRGDWWHAQAGSIATFAPDEPHFGGAGAENGWSQKIFYLPEELVREVLKDAEGRLRAAPGFKTPFHYDPAIALGLRRLWYLLERNASDLEIEVKLHEVLPRVFTRYGGWEDRVVRLAPATLARVRDYIHAYLDKPIQLKDLASIAGISKRSLINSFSCHFGLPPQRYLIQVRVNEARTLLMRGVEIVDVASAVGFADQSHLTRHFRSMLGVTPARYIRR